VRWGDPSGYTAVVGYSLSNKSAARNGVVLGLFGTGVRSLFIRAIAASILAPIYGDLVGDLLVGTAHELQRLIESVLSGETVATITTAEEASRVKEDDPDEEEDVLLYRAIDFTELSYIRGTLWRDYGHSPNWGGKPFALTREGARRFARNQSNKYNQRYTVTVALYSSEVMELGDLFYASGSADAGESIFFSDASLPQIYSLMKSRIYELDRINPDGWN